MNDERTRMIKWCLLKESDGTRGVAGKRKIYEITITDDHEVIFEWGRAEKKERQGTKVQRFYSDQAARRAASEQLFAKQAKGYVLAYTA